jgi:predicted enzyme related to lactoylglutathione lyase
VGRDHYSPDPRGADAFASAFPIVYTDDAARVLGFYPDLLGSAEAYGFPGGGAPACIEDPEGDRAHAAACIG